MLVKNTSLSNLTETMNKNIFLKKRIYVLLMCLALLISLIVPISASAATVTPKLNKTQITIGVKQNYKLKLSNNEKKVIWTSNKKSVATVSSKGVVTGKKKGTSVITAKVGKKKYRCEVIVKAPVLSKTKLTLNVNKNYTLKLLYNKYKVKWCSSNKSVATVNSAGKVIAKKKGTTIITAKVGSKKYNCKVIVNQLNAPTPICPVEPSDPVTPVCNHEWVNATQEITHPAITHDEPVYETKQVLVTPAWDERVYVKSVNICRQCGFETSDGSAMNDHLFDTGHSCTFKDIYETVHHDAVYKEEQVQIGTKTVVDTPAWTETVVIGQKCSGCGATK